MARASESPYPANAVFAVHKGFRTGVCGSYKDFLAQTEGFSESKLAWAVFTNEQHAAEYARTGICPVRPIDEKKALGVAAPPGSGRSLPTPDTSPETENVPQPLLTRQLHTSAPLTASASQPPPAPRKPVAQPEPDSDGDTEPEEDSKPPSSSLPARTPQNALPRRPFKSGSITQALKRHVSLTGGDIPGAHSPPPAKNAAPEPIPPSTAPAASGSGPSRQTPHGPSTASGSGVRTAPSASTAPILPTTPLPAPALFAAPAPVPTSAPAALVPDLPRQPRPHGTYEQCHHCDGKGWLFTPSHTTQPPQATVTQTPSRPRPVPTTNLRLVSTSDSDSAVSRIRTPSGSRLRLSSIGGVGPERTPRRDAKRSVSDTATARRRIVSDGTQGKGKGKGRASESMDIDASDPEAGPSAYNYM